MTPAYDLQFDEGAPIDATKLQQLVTYLNEVNSKALKVPDLNTLANQVVAQTMVAGRTDIINLPFQGQAKEIDITFQIPLTSNPACIIVTPESSSVDLDLIHYIKDGSATNTGFTLRVNRVAGTNEAGKIQAGAEARNIRFNYFALAKLV